MYGFLKRKFVLVSVKTLILVIFIHLFSIRVPNMATGREFSSISGYSGAIFVVFVLGSHGNPEPVTIFFSKYFGLGYLNMHSHQILRNLENHLSTSWYALSKNWS